MNKTRTYLRRLGSAPPGRPRAQRADQRRETAEWTLARIAEIDDWTVEPSCPVRNPPGVLTTSEIAELLAGLDPIAELIVCRLLNEFYDWPQEDRATLRAFARAGARLLLAERATTVAARHRVFRARARVTSLAAQLRLSTADTRIALAPPA